jgi:hypothetical protein
MPRARIIVVISSALALSACFLAGAGSEKKIADVVFNLNDQARWGRIDDAALFVDGPYRQRFVDQHRRWGSEIQLADSEVINIRLSSDSAEGSAFVSYSWYEMNDMTLHETTLQQQWKARGRTFALAAEVVVRGDPTLLSPPAKAPEVPASNP